jgi:hypothetical protein
MPRKYTKKKGGAAARKGKNTASSTGGSSRPTSRGSSSPSGSGSRPTSRGSSSPPGSGSRPTSRGSSSTPDSGRSKSRKKSPPKVKRLTKLQKAQVLNLKLIPKKSDAELALESRKDKIIEELKHMTNEQADEIFSDVEIVPGLEVKIYDNTNIELFLIEKNKELKLEYLVEKDFDIYIREFKKILAESGRVIVEVIKPDKLPYRYFYKSSGTSRVGTNLAGYYLPLDKIPIESMNQRFKKPEDEFVYSRNENKYSSGDGITLESMETYKRFMNEMNARICKTLFENKFTTL